MKTQTIISELTHDDLVNLFSTATYGSNYLGAGYSFSPDLEECETLEDAIAESLLKGRTVRVTDFQAEGSVFGSLAHEIDSDDESVTYTVTLDDIKNGLAKAADGTFKSSSIEFAHSERDFAKRAFNAFADEESCDFDLTYGDCLMQIILFNEIIYG